MKQFKETIVTTIIDTQRGIVARQEVIREPVRTVWWGPVLFIASALVRWFTS